MAVELRKRSREEVDEVRDCPICFERWENGGAHRLASLACGHLFGLSCIQKWVAQRRACPSCQRPARPKDVRVLFVDRVSVVDTSRQQDLQSQLADEKRRRCRDFMRALRKSKPRAARATSAKTSRGSSAAKPASRHVPANCCGKRKIHALASTVAEAWR